MSTMMAAMSLASHMSYEGPNSLSAHCIRMDKVSSPFDPVSYNTYEIHLICGMKTHRVVLSLPAELLHAILCSVKL